MTTATPSTLSQQLREDANWIHSPEIRQRVLQAADAHDALVAALREYEQFAFDYDNPNESFERVGQMYYLETARLRPGKDEGAIGCSGGDQEKRSRLFAEWCKQKQQTMLANARALLAKHAQPATGVEEGR